jgi:hypothetical protein
MVLSSSRRAVNVPPTGLTTRTGLRGIPPGISHKSRGRHARIKSVGRSDSVILFREKVYMPEPPLLNIALCQFISHVVQTPYIPLEGSWQRNHLLALLRPGSA